MIKLIYGYGYNLIHTGGELMDNNKKIIIAVIVIVAVLIIGLAAVMPNFGKEKANLTMKSNDTINQGESIKIELTDVNGTPIENETVNVTLTDENGTTDEKVAVTNETGVAKVEVADEDPGNYTVECTFEGNDNFTEDTITEEVEIVEEDSSESSPDEDIDYGAFYSEQEGRMIYTGEIHYAPDGHRYKHLGYNEWEMLD